MLPQTLSELTDASHHSVLLVLLSTTVLASYTDLARRRIPNWLTLSASLTGFALQTWAHGVEGLAVSLLGFLGCFGLGFLFYRKIGGVGAGDIKLIMAIAAICGAQATLWIAFVSFGLQVLWLFGCWTVRGTTWVNMQAMARWFLVLLNPHADKSHYVAIGTTDKSPHAPFVFLSTVTLLLCSS